MSDKAGFNDQTKETVVSTKLVKCPSCGANMVFNPDLFKLYCPHCESTADIDVSKKANEISLEEGFSKDEEWDVNESETYRCSNCGAKVVLNKNETANNCPFCGTAYVKETNQLAGLKPNAVVPFKFGLDKAVSMIKDWAKKRFFAPKSFKKNIKTDTVKSVYSPSFTFDSCTFSSYVGRLGETRTRTVGSGKNQRVETYTVWFNVSGSIDLNFNDVLINAGSMVKGKVIDKLQPFNTDGSIKFQENFLLGSYAYHYDYSIDDCWGEAKHKMDSIIKRSILSRYHYDKIDYINVTTSHDKVTYKYVMLPLYVGNFLYKSKGYNFFVNGENGKITGKTPKSPFKIGLTVFFSLAVIIGIILLFIYGK